MKRAMVFVLMLLAMTGWGEAAGTVTQSLTRYASTTIPGATIICLTMSVTADASDGSVPATAISAANLSQIKGMFLQGMETDPGSTAPTSNYDVTLTNANGYDLLGGNGANRSATSTEFVSTASPVASTSLTLNITNNSETSATITVNLYFSSQTAGAVGGTFSGTIGSVSQSGDWTFDLTKVGGVAVGATNGLYVRPGTSSTWAATQSGTWTVQPGNTANTTAWLVTGTGGTFPATQSGTWSTRLQDGSGNAVSSATRGSVQALTTQLVDASGNQITTFGGGTQYDAGAATGSTTGTISHGVSTSAAPTYTTDKVNPLSLTTAGLLRVAVEAGGGTGGTSSSFSAGFPATGTAIGFSSGGNMVGISSSAPLPVTLANTGANATALLVDGNGGTFAVTQGTATSLKTQAEAYQGGNAVATGNALFVQPGTAATFPVSAASLPLPTGAATAALQGGGLPAALGAGGGLKVDGSGTALPVSGTVTANAGSGTFTVSGTVTANAGTGTLAVSAASLPLPTGASTAAKQPALGTAGSASSDVITVQGISGGTALPVSSATLATAAKQPALGTAGTASADVITVQGVASMTPILVNPGTADAAPGAERTNPPVPIAGVDYAGTPLIRIPKVNSSGTQFMDLSASAANTTAGLLSVKFDQTTDGTTNKTAANLYQGGSAVATGNGVYVQPGSGASFTVAQGTAASLKTAAVAYQGTDPVSASNGLYVAPANSTTFTTTGTIAHDTADSGNPNKIGAVAKSDDQTAVADADRVNLVADLNGKLVTSPFAPLELYASATSNVTSTTEADIVAASADYRYCITSITVYNSSAADTVLNLYEDGSGGTLKGVYPAPAKGGISLSMPTPMCMSAKNKKITIDEAATADAIYVTLTYFKIKR